MGALMRRIETVNGEVHESTGKLAPGGERHEPQWSEPVHEWGGIMIRQCQHPDCDLDQYVADVDVPEQNYDSPVYDRPTAPRPRSRRRRKRKAKR